MQTLTSSASWALDNATSQYSLAVAIPACAAVFYSPLLSLLVGLFGYNEYVIMVQSAKNIYNK